MKYNQNEVIGIIGRCSYSYDDLNNNYKITRNLDDHIFCDLYKKS